MFPGLPGLYQVLQMLDDLIVQCLRCTVKLVTIFFLLIIIELVSGYSVLLFNLLLLLNLIPTCASVANGCNADSST
jgi:hypothetical protein